MNDELKALRLKWLKAAKAYYIHPGDDTGMEDLDWDAAARTLFAARDQFPDCPILNEPTYQCGSLFWVSIPLYAEALETYK